MKNPFAAMDIKTMLQLNAISIFITAICEIFAISIFMSKGMQADIEHWKYIAIIIGLVVISLLFIGSLVSMVLFVIIKNKKK